MTLRLDWCSHQAAKWAVEHWYYSRTMPAGKLTKIGVWEDDAFIGVVLFGRGAIPEIGKPFGLLQTEVCELVRVALRTHIAPVSRILAISLRFLHRFAPGLRLVVSYADKEHGHHGGIYQATNWLYLGETKPDSRLIVHGEVCHRRSLTARYGQQGLSWIQHHVDPCAKRVYDAPKHKYVYPLDAAMRAQLLPLAKAYPRRQPLESEGTTSQVDQGAAMRPDGSTVAEVSA
jgi:hypothetical protein